MPVSSKTSRSKEKSAKGSLSAPPHKRHTFVSFSEQKEPSENFLSDSALEAIKLRLRKKHRRETTKLLVVYGILILIFIWYVLSYQVFS
ncbi:hypothetical protein [Robertkochia sediminum]|uniref:hypothetical protein n=1 Tax=Robertkochia sediminum TaxID=2785326 RepID=UPI0019347A77|nr:hypothetical protein [Robertkochia sediminum]MBL7473611.1 hypothetical protein [Robertkochia sediminum]